MVQQPLSSIGLCLVLAGMLLAIATVFLLALSGARGRRVRGGGIIVIGPFPFIFGSDIRIVRVLAVIALVLVVVFLVTSLM